MSFEDSGADNATNVLIGAVVGATAGAIAVWAMDRLDWFAYNHVSEKARERTVAARPQGMDPAHVMVDKIAGVTGKDISQPHPAGLAAHYSLGILPGALYGAMYRKVPVLSAGRGSAFGLGLFLMQDEGLNAVTGLSGKPQEYPWQAHARGLVAHVVYGIVTDTVVRLANRALR
ncbi:DUF1440 domain-containing protein [Pseudomonas sp. Q2-TVG4-2]|uniref:DUF1440 domain-containing protein n=1 Tax=Pseudomonas sp. Q2-TVG4-2 TaxID=1685699 RepID=UPI0015E74F4F|nr:DUF1440 domain-containing protein [Pseudomonas sp. Q2-TVG4-2]